MGDTSHFALITCSQPDGTAWEGAQNVNTKISTPAISTTADTAAPPHPHLSVLLTRQSLVRRGERTRRKGVEGGREAGKNGRRKRSENDP